MYTDPSGRDPRWNDSEDFKKPTDYVDDLRNTIFGTICNDAFADPDPYSFVKVTFTSIKIDNAQTALQVATAIQNTFQAVNESDHGY
jgi:hypothetical protein